MLGIFPLCFYLAFQKSELTIHLLLCLTDSLYFEMESINIL